MSGDLPTMVLANYASSQFAPQGMGLGAPAGWKQDHELNAASAQAAVRSIAGGRAANLLQPQKEIIVNRVVQIYIADVNENLPLDKRLVYTGSQKFTDLSDQELFYEVPILSLLDAHNKLRAVTPDKPASNRAGKDIFLEPIRIRDLKMTVTQVATF